MSGKYLLHSLNWYYCYSSLLTNQTTEVEPLREKNPLSNSILNANWTINPLISSKCGDVTYAKRDMISASSSASWAWSLALRLQTRALPHEYMSREETRPNTASPSISLAADLLWRCCWYPWRLLYPSGEGTSGISESGKKTRLSTNLHNLF